MRNKKANPLVRFIILVLILLTPFLLAKAYWSNLTSPLDVNGEIKVFVIAPGESVSQVSDRLEKEKFIKSSLVFKIAYRLSGTQKIEAGDFKLSPSMSLEEILTTLSRGSIDKWVTLIEGWRVEEIAEKLSKELGINKEEFINLAKKDEGYLFPDTYLFNPDAKAEDIISILRNTFLKKYDSDLQTKVKTKGLTSQEGVILASIVEREARSDEARKMVASILLKRLKIGMGLNADATVQYVLGYRQDEKSWWKRHLDREDLRINSPYNTYIYNGLPPTPICNPSLSALKAVANSADTPYLYYYHDSKGKSHYATTLQEHNENIANNP